MIPHYFNKSLVKGFAYIGGAFCFEETNYLKRDKLFDIITLKEIS